MKSWYILLVRQGFEQTVRDQLITNQKHLDFCEVFISQELSGYVFIRSNEILQSHVNSFLVFNGVLKFLGTKKEGPQKFSTAQIKQLNTTDVPLKKKKNEDFKKGDHVVIKHGDLSNIDGVIVDIKKRVVKIQPVYFEKIVKARIQDIDFI